MFPPLYLSMSRTSILYIFCFSILVPQFSFALKETAVGRLDVSASLTGKYDSRVFGISSSAYQASKNSSSSLIASQEIKSEDDFIISFTPALHLSKKLRWFGITGSAGVQITQYIKKDDKSYVIPITTLSVDFDESLKKRVSNNAKIRFSATFDLGQRIDTSVLEQDLVSYSYFLLGLDVRYNHSAKFGVAGGTSYSLKKYQSGSVSERAYQDLSTLPLHATAFYIYSEKLDFFTQYGFSQSKGKGSSAPSLTDSVSHSVSFGANGDLSPKLTGNAQLGYAVVDYENPTSPNQENLTMGVALTWKLNVKTSLNFDVDRSFSPSAQGFSMFSTMSRLGATHRFTQDLSGTAYLSYGVVDYTYANIPSMPSRDTSTLNQFGTGFSVRKTLSEHFSTSGGYDYSHSKRDVDSFGRHLLTAQITGRF
jgi:hypothetical protein